MFTVFRRFRPRSVPRKRFRTIARGHGARIVRAQRSAEHRDGRPFVHGTSRHRDHGEDDHVSDNVAFEGPGPGRSYGHGREHRPCPRSDCVGLCKRPGTSADLDARTRFSEPKVQCQYTIPGAVQGRRQRVFQNILYDQRERKKVSLKI